MHRVAHSKRISKEYHTALHEAGHAVAAFELRIPFKRVSIIPDSENLGHMLRTVKLPQRPFRLPKDVREEKNPERRAFMGKAFRQAWEAENDPETSPRSPHIKDWLERHIMCLFAGDTAARLLSGRADRVGPRGDYHDIVQNFSRVASPGKAEEYYLRWLGEETRTILDRSHVRAAIHALAEALIRDREIGERRVRRIIREAYEESLKPPSPFR